jgi:hypothetical protein
MKKHLLVTLTLVVSAAAQNLTPAQKEADFRYMASLISTYYAPVDWKKQLFNFDAMKLGPWLDRVAKTQTDLDFYEVEAEYLASLNDTHTWFELPSDYAAILGFTVDIYDGALLVESISRSVLPSRDYPFAAGDELVSIDGVDAQTVLEGFLKYYPQGNPRAARRMAAAGLTNRYQWLMPYVPDAGAKAAVVIKRQNGNSESYTIPWTTSGTKLEVGPVPSPKSAGASALRARGKKTAIPSGSDPDYMKPLNELRWSGVLDPERTGLIGYGSRSPIFVNGLPSTFPRRLGSKSTDFFYSGTFKFLEFTIGYIRIPSYSPSSSATALQQLDTEIAYMNANTDGLIVDEMRNPGGNLCFGENVAQRLIPYPFRATGFETRPFWSRIVSFYNATVAAKAAGAPWEVVALYETVYKELVAANQEGRTVTNPIPICTYTLDRQPVTDANGSVAAYQKPLMFMIDDFSTSTADSVAGMIQDNQRGVLFGMRSNGAGGNNTSYDAGVYSESYIGVTLALQSRKDWVGTVDYPTTKYIENVGVRPEVVEDYMTKNNLLKSGAPFIDSFLQHMAAYIRSKK